MKYHVTHAIQFKLHEKLVEIEIAWAKSALKRVWRHIAVIQTLQTKSNITGQVLTYNSKNFHWLNKNLDHEWNGKTIYKTKSIRKIKRTVKTVDKLPHLKKFAIESLLLLKNCFLTLLENSKSFTPQNPLAFLLHLLFGRDQNQYSNLTSKIMKMFEHIRKT